MGTDERGITFQFVVGRWGGFHGGLLEHSFHITIGWFSFQVWFVDMDKYVSRLQNGYQHMFKMAGYWKDKYMDAKGSE